MNKIWNWLKVHAKTFVAFLAGVIGNMIVNLINGSAVWPQTKEQWLQYAITSFGTAIAVWFTRNKITQKQLDRDPHVIGGTVVPDSQAVRPSPPSERTYRNPWQ